MTLSELTAYANEKYHIREEHKWADFPGFSVLCSPSNGKWVALLMRYWDRNLGEEIECCDLKCGQEILSFTKRLFLTKPLRMKGEHWIGIYFNNSTDQELVCRLFDRAVNLSAPVLKPGMAEDAHTRGGSGGYTIVIDSAQRTTAASYHDTPIATGRSIPQWEGQQSANNDMPEQIQQMIRLYDYSDGSFLQKGRNFYRQGKFMENYTDDAPYTLPFKHYFTTYHDLNVRQLRGYFTWRTRLRQGEWQSTSLSLAYLYVYELLCGIGTSSVEERLEKLELFEHHYIDAGYADSQMRSYLHRWMMELSVITAMPVETARRYADPVMLKRDEMLAVLKSPCEHSDDAVFEALCTMAGKKLDFSPVVRKKDSEAQLPDTIVETGRHLFALAWREGQLFESCFGRPKWYKWYPLYNAVYYDEQPPADSCYTLNDCRRYRCCDGLWQMECYEPLNFDRKRLLVFLRVADRLFRKFLKRGGALKANYEDVWAVPVVNKAIESYQRERMEAARPKISIDLSGLDQIRRDAVITRDSLLSEEEQMETILADMPSAPAATDSIDTQILKTLLQGGDIGPLITAHHLLPSVVADRINEAYFDDIGDNIIEEDGNTLTLVDDYVDDLRQLLLAE